MHDIPCFSTPRTLLEDKLGEDHLAGGVDFIEVILKSCLEEWVLASDESKVGCKLQLDRLLDHFLHWRHIHMQHGTLHYIVRAAWWLDVDLDGIWARCAGSDIFEFGHARRDNYLLSCLVSCQCARGLGGGVQQQRAVPCFSLLNIYYGNVHNCINLAISKHFCLQEFTRSNLYLQLLYLVSLRSMMFSWEKKHLLYFCKKSWENLWSC